MKERPILFNSEMVRAILDGRKTQTRRIWKMPSWAEWDLQEGGEKSGNLIPKDPKNGAWYSVDEVACPYGETGDRLWVRETWRIGAWDCETGGIAVDYRADESARREWINIEYGDDGEEFDRYVADSIQDCIDAGFECDADGGYRWEPGQSPCRWRSSIHMPRWASRIQLEITGIRVERLQDISEADAMAEGIDAALCAELTTKSPWVGICAPAAVHAYAALWESINGTGSWDANPWVWVIEFCRIEAGEL